jgi:hypothetical protein
VPRLDHRCVEQPSDGPDEDRPDQPDGERESPARVLGLLLTLHRHSVGLARYTLDRVEMIARTDVARARAPSHSERAMARVADYIKHAVRPVRPRLKPIRGPLRSVGASREANGYRFRPSR